MDRTAIKAKARQIVKTNFTKLLVPLGIHALAYVIIMSFLPYLFGSRGILFLDLSFMDGIEHYVPNAKGFFYSYCAQAPLAVLKVAFYSYCLQLVRYRSATLKDYFRAIRSKYLTAALIGCLTEVLIPIGLAFLIVPGIYLLLGFSMALILVADRHTTNVLEILAESLKLMRGYMLDMFVFMLSFSGWALLAGITFGLGAIWLIPYMSVATVLYYEELRNKAHFGVAS
ncbi:MAG: DUF975 family protein [Eubacteriaceae bacterium]|nr:DUF975 family protein [Eubacteriaceae bacterium]